jgi:hypothetical protein
MKNRNEIIKELYRNIQLMDVNPELLDEAVNPFKWMKSLFSKSKISFEDLLDKLIKNDTTIKKILDEPNTNQAHIDFKNAYDNYIGDVKNLNFKYDLINKYLHLSNPSLLEKTDFLLRGLNMTYSGLSEHLTKIMSRFDPNNPQAFNQSFEDYLTSAGINNSKQREVFRRYFDIYKKYGSGRSRGLVETQSIDALTKLAKQRNFFELINFWKLTFKSINQAFKKNKSDLEIKILDKYVGYLDDLAKIKDQEQRDNATLAYKKYIDNTFRSYLMQQNSTAFNYIFKFAENLKMEYKNPAAESLEDIINDLVGSSLSQKYPGFRLTAILNSKLGGNTKFEQNFNLIKYSIKPQYPQIYNNILTKILPDKFNFLLKNKSLNRVIRTQLFGVFPNTELLYRLIAQNKDAIKNKNVKKLLVIYIKYVMYNLVRNAYMFIYMPAIYGLYNSGLYILKDNYPDLVGSLTPEEEELLKGSWVEDAAAVFGREVSLHIQKTFWVVDNNESLGNKILKIAANIITPPEITSFNNSVMANVAVFIGNKGIASGPDVKYESFTQLFMNTVIFKIDDIIRGLFNGATSTGAEIQDSGTEIQAGGGQIDVNDKTWRFSTTSLPTSKIVEINFPFNKTKQVIVNDRYRLGNKFFRNLNSKVGVNIPNTITITSIKVIENNNTTHNFKLKNKI